jgi:hypothetical protein
VKLSSASEDGSGRRRASALDGAHLGGVPVGV